MLSRTILTQTAKWIQKVKDTDDFKRPIYGKPSDNVNPSSRYDLEVDEETAEDTPYEEMELEIPCRREGSRKYYPVYNTIKAYNAFQYILIHPVKESDLLDGQVVISVNTCYDFRGNISHYEVNTGDFKE